MSIILMHFHIVIENNSGFKNKFEFYHNFHLYLNGWGKITPKHVFVLQDLQNMASF